MVGDQNPTVMVGDQKTNKKKSLEIESYLKPSWVLDFTKRRVLKMPQVGRNV
jgi:hypothetical protein